MNKTSKIFVLSIFFFCAIAGAASAADSNFGENSISVSPLSLLSLAIPVNPGDFREMLWLGIDFNWQQPRKQELSVGLDITPSTIGARVQKRYYTKGNHSGFLYGIYGRLEYQKLYWGYTDDDELQVLTILGKDKGEYTCHSVGAIFGGDTGYRWRGKNVGGTLYAGAGLPLFYCFGEVPEGDDLMLFYATNALMRVFELGLKIDFYF